MQDLLQGLQNAREIVASSPVVLEQLQSMLTNPATTPLQRMMMLRNLTFRTTRTPPDQRNNRRGATTFQFGSYRQIRTKVNYV